MATAAIRHDFVGIGCRWDLPERAPEDGHRRPDAGLETEKAAPVPRLDRAENGRFRCVTPSIVTNAASGCQRQRGRGRRRSTRWRRISAAGIGPNRLRQNRLILWQRSISAGAAKARHSERSGSRTSGRTAPADDLRAEVKSRNGLRRIVPEGPSMRAFASIRVTLAKPDPAHTASPAPDSADPRGHRLAAVRAPGRRQAYMYAC